MSGYDPDYDPEVYGEAVVWGWKLHFGPKAVSALVETEEVIDKIVKKILKQPELEELKPIAKAINMTLKRHRKREQRIAERWGTGVCLVSPWVMPTLLRPVKQHEDDTHMSWSALDLGKRGNRNWSESQLMTDAFQTETGPAVIGFDDKLFSVYRGAGDDTQLYYTVFQRNGDDSDDWSDPQALGPYYTSDEPALAVMKGELFCFCKGARDNKIWYMKWTGNGWSSCGTIPGLLSQAGPGAAVWNDQANDQALFVAVPGSKDSGHEDHFGWAVFDNERWNGPYWAPKYTTHLPPALVMHNGQIHAIYTGTNGTFYHLAFTSNSTLSDQTKLTNHESKDGPSVVSYDGVLYLVARGIKDEKIWFTYSTDDWGHTWADHVPIKTPGLLYSGKRPGLTTWRHSTGTRDQLLMLYRGAKV